MVMEEKNYKYIRVKMQLYTDKELTSIMKKWFNIRYYGGGVWLDKNIEMDSEEYKKLLFIIENWNKYDIAPERSYLYTYESDAKRVTLITNKQIKILSAYRPEAIRIMTNKLFYGMETCKEYIDNLSNYLYEEDENALKLELINLVKENEIKWEIENSEEEARESREWFAENAVYLRDWD